MSDTASAAPATAPPPAAETVPPAPAPAPVGAPKPAAPVLPGKSMVALAVAARLHELAAQAETLVDHGLLKWAHLEALQVELRKVIDSVGESARTFKWADDLISDGGKLTLEQIVGDAAKLI